MAHRVSASITLGGTITADIYAGLVEHIAEVALATEWGGEPFSPDQRAEGASLALFAYEVPDGEFRALEAYCVEHEIAFARWSASYPGAFAAERIVFPGAGEPHSYIADEEDHILIGRDTVEALGSFEAVLAYFDEAGFDVPPLIVGD